MCGVRAVETPAADNRPGNKDPFREITCHRPKSLLKPEPESSRNQINGSTMSLAARLQVTSTDYQRLQADLSSVVEARQRLDAQLSENELVKKVRPSLPHHECQQQDLTIHLTQEFTTLTPNNVVYKLVGPVLVKQDQAEAKSNVDKRLEFIRGEMSV
jgi:chaperonin cofactor prefoldin